MSLRKESPQKCSPAKLVHSKLIGTNITITEEKSTLKMSATSVIKLKKLPKVNNHPIGENSPKLVALASACLHKLGKKVNFLLFIASDLPTPSSAASSVANFLFQFPSKDSHCSAAYFIWMRPGPQRPIFPQFGQNEMRRR
jgi:hypothetical protein